MGMARGSVGDVVFWRGDNEQLSRARNRKPANPRTDPQLTSRILLKTVSLAYSQFMFDFANQTFQGASNPRDNQRRFLSANIRKMRQRISEGATGDMNFAYRDDTTALLNRYTVSEGILPSVIYSMTSSGGASAIAFGNAFLSAGEDPTYQEICDSLGLAAGSQLTFMLVRANQGVIEFVKRARIILSPASGDMSAAFLGDGGSINDPNPENDFNIGTFTWTRPSATTGQLGISLVTEYQALAIVASYNDGSGWKYSWQELWYNPNAGYGTHTLPAAIESWKTEAAGSDKYTRQANKPDYTDTDIDIEVGVNFYNQSGVLQDTQNFADFEIGDTLTATPTHDFQKAEVFCYYSGVGEPLTIEVTPSASKYVENGYFVVNNTKAAWPQTQAGEGQAGTVVATAPDGTTLFTLTIEAYL